MIFLEITHLCQLSLPNLRTRILGPVWILAHWVNFRSLTHGPRLQTSCVRLRSGVRTSALSRVTPLKNFSNSVITGYLTARLNTSWLGSRPLLTVCCNRVVTAKGPSMLDSEIPTEFLSQIKPSRPGSGGNGEKHC